MGHEVTVPLWVLLSNVVTVPAAAWLGVVCAPRLERWWDERQARRGA